MAHALPIFRSIMLMPTPSTTTTSAEGTGLFFRVLLRSHSISSTMDSMPIIAAPG
jgi:hypothetical protein